MPIATLWKLLTTSMTLTLSYLYIGYMSIEIEEFGATITLLFNNVFSVLNALSLLNIILVLCFYYHYNVQAKPTAPRQKSALT